MSISNWEKLGEEKRKRKARNARVRAIETKGENVTLETASERELRRARARRLVALDVALDDERRFLRFDGAGQTENSPPDDRPPPPHSSDPSPQPFYPIHPDWLFRSLATSTRVFLPFSRSTVPFPYSVLPFRAHSSIVPLFLSTLQFLVPIIRFRFLFFPSSLPFFRFDNAILSLSSKGLLKTTLPLFEWNSSSLTRRDVVHDVMRHCETRVTRLYATENKGVLLVVVHVRIGARMRSNKSPCEPRYDCSFVHYDRYVNRRVSSNFPAPHRLTDQVQYINPGQIQC